MTANDETPTGQLPPGYTAIGAEEAAELTGRSAEPFTPGTAGAIRDVGPDEARALVRQAAARYVAARLDGKRVAKYASLMLLGTWQPSSEPIPITEDGYLVNGLNRLMAIILSGTTQRMVIVTDPQPVAELRMAWHSGPRVCDIEPLPEDHPDRNAF